MQRAPTGIRRANIAFAYDFFRTPLLSLGDFEIYGRWFHNLFRSTIEYVGGRPQCLTEKGPDPDIKVTHALERNGWSPDIDGWLRAYGADEEISCAYEAFSKFDFVVGWGSSPSLLKYLNRLQIPFLDVFLDPIRFAEDLHLTARTNDHQIEALLKSNELTDDALFSAVGLLRSRIERATRLRDSLRAPIQDSGRKATLFVGQGDIDSTLIVDGKLATVSDYITEIAASVPAGQPLLIKPHPQARKHADIRRLHDALPNSMFISENIYALLHSTLIGNVITLSSSVAAEAKFFGIPGKWLIAPDRERLGDMTSRWYRVPYEQMNVGFWRNIVENTAPAQDKHVERSMSGQLRKSIGYGWGFKDTDTALIDRRAPIGEHVRFSKDARGGSFLAFGWHLQEGWGCWSAAEQATLLIQLDRSCENIEIEFEIKALVLDEMTPVDVTIYARGSRKSPSQSRRIANATDIIMVGLALGAPGDDDHDLVEIQFEIKGARSPAEAGGSDQRVLGIGLIGMTVRVPHG